VTTEESKVLRIFERKVVRKIYGPVKIGESWRIITNEDVQDILRREDILKFMQTL
jgi:hypothetical protein